MCTQPARCHPQGCPPLPTLVRMHRHVLTRTHVPAVAIWRSVTYFQWGDLSTLAIKRAESKGKTVTAPTTHSMCKPFAPPNKEPTARATTPFVTIRPPADNSKDALATSPSSRLPVPITQPRITSRKTNVPKVSQHMPSTSGEESPGSDNVSLITQPPSLCQTSTFNTDSEDSEQEVTPTPCVIYEQDSAYLLQGQTIFQT